MFQKIIQFSIKNKLAVGVFTVALIIWGVISAMRLPIDAVPDITNNQVQIITQAPTLGAQEVEQFITTPVELAMANIPNVIVKRSISRSGISVITIVFKDNADIYWARQQINERLKEAEAQIPQGVGEPTLAPITTGLGEIYQYIIHPAKGYENKYTATDLRTIQDWIVRRQLAGTEGLAEVSGWGGYVKQYEIALDNDKLNAMNITIPEIYKALENNNENTGGSYIEQRSNAYFIRGLGLVKSLSDIEKIVVKNINGMPVLIRDVATVQFGSAIRYGAVTRNGEGEVVAGITLMLKGENFAQVIANVKERMKQVQKSLPEGVIIEPFIDRTELVNRAMGTVEKNLIEGGLIVIFVLVLLLGNLRAGLIVASIIPLSMLFAISLMNLFGVSGNLMSLGAIDFGLIVDGAVIIVESVVHHLFMSKHHHHGILKLSQPQMDNEVYETASRMMSSASFGQIIILIVYLPILSLVGIEGKMFKPMAQTVAFALLGAFILSLTYVPVASSLFLSKRTAHKINISDRIMNFIKKVYTPVLNFTLRWKKTVVLSMIALFAISLIIFNGLGGEFIPTLEEGDLTVEIRMEQGVSLTKVVETFSKAEKILKDKFPEINQAVTRIGSAEIPTDPMPVERGDMMLAMKSKEEWTSAHTREEMMEKMEEALSILPGVSAEITQPMQMRFNELITGIRQDVAIKVYGADLEILNAQANKIAGLIKNVKGVSEPIVEKVNGLPQIQVEYNRDKIAQYGLTISDVNMILKTAFAGNVAGVVFEGDKRFDMVVRLKKDLRQDLSNIQNLYVPLPSGNKVPLNQVADISFKDAPAQISHEDGQRRTYVGFNVHGRDVESTVEEIQQILDTKLKLPVGYYYTYGGQFQNLKEAKGRLGIAIPVALLLILILLYFTFHSIKQSLLIFSAVPLSAIGGIIALWVRGMPFSISAGVGFIALFGVAVLNGIVLIGYFNQLKEEGITDIYERVRKGTAVRLRPVIMTAMVASLGFLPMALSTGAGGEVQKPLATVVIGGLITATVLTMLVLPALYILFNSKINLKITKMKKEPTLGNIPIILLIIGLGCLFANKSNAQGNQRTLQQCIDTALRNNLQIKAADLNIQHSTVLQRTAFNPDKTFLQVTQDPTSGGNIDNSIGITQNFAFPTVYANQSKVLKQETLLAQKSKLLSRNEIIKEVTEAYYALLFGLQRVKLLQQQDSIYNNFLQRATLRYNTGETNLLEKMNAESRYRENQLLLKQANTNVGSYQLVLQKWLNTTEQILPEEKELQKLPDVFNADTSAVNNNPLMSYFNQSLNVNTAQLKLEQSKFLPDLSIGYFHQAIIKSFDPASIDRKYFPGTRMAGIQVGIGVPLFFGSQKAKVKAVKINNTLIETQRQQALLYLQNNYAVQYNEYLKAKEALQYYETVGLKQADDIFKISSTAYTKGEIGYMEYIQNLQTAINTRLQYADAVNQYNQSIILLNYLKGN
ncbi:cobalt-zinc-cadmium resistance protein CzcA [Hydrobacter penzbergensis]|uniref:Cobalt-zinc-cadmium resistance protein CzcA n=1 Tax=Hydrobacter penzbergensis TaxID=1235997 RepID=A0A8X8LAN9_9BACT|nr:CusA/CzcA family heavy metal efflux RND transporter [Hydrobacter penzbergensis]SDW51337.1 cobalt-zinc-cadmium resistance protein CzcA [Hydrobacter penzbergensis]